MRIYLNPNLCLSCHVILRCSIKKNNFSIFQPKEYTSSNFVFFSSAFILRTYRHMLCLCWNICSYSGFLKRIMSYLNYSDDSQWIWNTYMNIYISFVRVFRFMVSILLRHTEFFFNTNWIFNELCFSLSICMHKWEFVTHTLYLFVYFEKVCQMMNSAIFPCFTCWIFVFRIFREWNLYQNQEPSGDNVL